MIVSPQRTSICYVEYPDLLRKRENTRAAVKQRLTFLKPLMKYAILPRIVNSGFVGINPYAKINTILKLFA